MVESIPCSLSTRPFFMIFRFRYKTVWKIFSLVARIQTGRRQKSHFLSRPVLLQPFANKICLNQESRILYRIYGQHSFMFIVTCMDIPIMMHTLNKNKPFLVPLEVWPSLLLAISVPRSCARNQWSYAWWDLNNKKGF